MPGRAVAFAAVVLAASLVPSGPLRADESPAQLAERERERRAKLKEPAREYTNEDLGEDEEPEGSQTREGGAERRLTPTQIREQARRARGRQPASEGSEGGEAGERGEEGRVASEDGGDPERSAGAGSAISADGEAAWRARAEAIRETISAKQAQLDATRDEIVRIRQDRNPLENVMAANREQQRAAKLSAAEARLEQLEAELQQAQEDLAEFERQARRARVPSGWLR